MWQSNRIALCLTVLALTAVWGVGLFSRGWWRPDEPREAALVQSMVARPHQVLPELSGRTFAEKPPLTYHLAARSVEALGMSPASTRLPQLLYAILAFASILVLTRAMAGPAAALMATTVFATFALVYQTQIWLACDALAIAGISVSLLGLYCGLMASRSSARVCGYLLMHAGLTLAFFGKNFAAWLVPGSAFVVFLVWERRLRELLRWELWIGAIIPATCIGAWITHIATTPNGAQTLRVLFWHNLIGRMVPVASLARYAYTESHRNWPAKYFIELPFYLLPWTTVAWAAARRAWQAVRIDSHRRAAWRFAVCAVLPALIVLSFSATARGIYAAQCLAGVALLIALWAVETEQNPSSGKTWVLRVTGGVMATMSAIVLLATLVLLLATHQFVIFAAVGLVACAIILWAILRISRRSSPDSHTQTLTRLGLAYAALLSIGVWPLYRTFNSWQDLSEVAAGTQAALSHRPFVLWRPDETTLAWTDLYLKEKPQRIFFPDDTPMNDGLAPLLAYLQKNPQAEVLILADKRRWPLSRWVKYLRTGTNPSATNGLPDFAAFADRQDFQLDYSYEAPGGRRYVLLHRRMSRI